MPYGENPDPITKNFTEAIFASTAPAMWEKGLQVIPLQHKSKKPVTQDWSRYATEEVTHIQQQEWLRQHSKGNIGLVLGAASGLTMIDIDTEDSELEEIIKSVLPPSPWLRHGKKGSMLAFKFAGHKTFRIKNISGETIVECLSTRTQCVVPPSIHPDTNLPYRENKPLIECLHQMMALPENIEQVLRDALSNYGVKLSHAGWTKLTEYTPAGARDSTLTGLAGLFAFSVIRGERSLLEAISMLRSHEANFVEHVAGDPVDIEKHVENLIKFLLRDVLERKKVLPPGWDEGLSPEELKGMGIDLTRDHVEWKFQEILDHLKDKFEKNRLGSDRSEAVEDVLLKIANSRQMSQIDEARILTYIKDTSGLGITLSMLRARLKVLRQGDVLGTDHNELARAVLADLTDYNEIRFNDNKFMKWNGAFWEDLEPQKIYHHISTRYGHLPAAKRASDLSGIVRVMQFNAEQNIRRKNVTGVNFANGFLTQELKLIPHEPDFGMTYVLPFRYMPEEAGKFPIFAAFLNSCWGADVDYHEKMDALQETMAVTLFGLGPKFQRAVLLQGAPQTGKTQLLRIIETLVPKEAKCAVPPNQWHDKFLPTMMKDKLLNICGELSSKHQIDGQRFKDVIDGSEMHGQLKGQQIFLFHPHVTHWFASNHMPKSEDTSMGFIRRWIFLTFNHPIPEDKKITDLGDLISALEREAIVAWAAEAITRLVEKQRYSLPTSHRRIVEDFANLNNSVRFFLKESGKVKFQPGSDIEDSALYNHYWAFCASGSGQRPASLMQFKEMMRELCSELPIKHEIVQGKMGVSVTKYVGIAA